MDIKIYDYIVKNKDRFVLSKKTSFMKAYLLGEFNDNQIFIKKIDVAKIREVYNGNYCKTWEKYYDVISKIFNCVHTYGIYDIDGEIYEVYDRLNNKLFLENGNIFNWEDYLSLFKKILIDIQKFANRESENGDIIGIESTMWNFTIEGKFFDFSPPRYMENKNSSIFTRKNDIDHYKRTFYRSYTPLGMKLSTINSAICVVKNGEVNVKDLPIDWQQQLLKILFDNCNYYEYSKIYNYLYNNVSLDENFSKHPLMILKSMVETR